MTGDVVTRPVIERRKLSDCRPTGWRRGARVALLLGVALLAVAAAVLPAGTAEEGCGEAQGLDAGSLYYLLFAGCALWSLRGGIGATAAIGGVGIVTAISRAIMLTTCDSGDGVIAAILLFPAGMVVLLGDPLLHGLERWHREVEVDPVVATARVHRR